jgi:hypothetical protein
MIGTSRERDTHTCGGGVVWVCVKKGWSAWRAAPGRVSRRVRAALTRPIAVRGRKSTATPGPTLHAAAPLPGSKSTLSLRPVQSPARGATSNLVGQPGELPLSIHDSACDWVVPAAHSGWLPCQHTRPTTQEHRSISHAKLSAAPPQSCRPQETLEKNSVAAA